MKTLWLSLAFALVTGCAAVRTDVSQEPTAPDTQAEALSPSVARVAKALDLAPATPNRPQLAKTANLSLEVTDVANSAQQAIGWARQAGGEVLNLEDNGVLGEVRRLTLEVQVPATQLEPVLGQLAALGTLESRQITAEDVGSQLVDLGARLRNLRKSETLLLKIMERAGSVGDVLKVTQELSQVREQIEQLSAQQVNLQNRVSYSRIRLNLISPTAETPGLSVPERLGATWQQATTTLGNVTLGLVQVFLWLLVFSPYFLVPGLILWLVRRRSPQRPAPPPSQS
ncbi:hypothetical protein GlitD10_2799 [Gloeomargarita lithophora Alchichica-D10]|uniref:DUF4349 domain-containing protein n=1 Tax=Gloeomargarita lithophora Alchichica-D10 TaxID=1188229 RepID=A0A1J0AGT0_9CYAN|nr:DUF4349 domain-containing protein [Gloeomargarita lithophora]APB35142.1 hypothetical protein GlitD10_2799 [Gloeomargarita lithophora Alchichica-D10]